MVGAVRTFLPKKIAGLAIRVVGIGLFLSSCSASNKVARERADTLFASISSDIRSTEPGVNRDANTDTVMAHVLEGLVAYDETGQPQPMLASSITISPDGRSYRFILRPDIHFHNGAPLTSQDVVWSWKRYLDPNTRWACLRDFDGSSGSKILSVETDGAQAVIFRLKEPQPSFLSQMAAVQCGQSAIIHPDSLASNGNWHTPVATGPYRLGHWVRGEYLELEAFDSYVPRREPRDGLGGGKQAATPRIRWIVIRDGTSRLAALVKGQIDIMPESTSAELHQLRRYKDLRVDTAPGAVVNAILIQPRKWPLSDGRFRRALALSVDRSAIANLTSAGTAMPNASLVPASSPDFNAGHRAGLTADLAEARQLLAEMGYNGEPVELATNRRYTDMFDQALLVQAMARETGINIKLSVSEWASQLDAYAVGNFELMSFAYSARAEPVLTYDSIIGARDKNARKQWGSPGALALVAEAQAAKSQVDRRRALDKLHRLMLEEVPLIVLFNPADNNAVRSDVAGFKSWPLGRARLWGVSKKGTHS